ncbi:hypothetical protein Tco_1500212 [Tanacetum coccineum]
MKLHFLFGFPPLLPATEDPAAPVINFEAVDSFLHKFHAFKKDVQELKQADHSTAILESIRSQVPSIVKDSLRSNIGDELQKVLQSHTKGLKKELTVKKAQYKEFIEESVTNDVKNQLSKILLKAVSDFATLILMEKMKGSQSYQTDDEHKILYDELVNSYLLDKDLFESYVQTVSLKRNHEEDKDEDPSAGPNQGKETKKRRTGKEAESSKKSLIPRNLPKANLHQKPTFENVANDANVPHVDPKPRILKPDWFTQPPRPETPEPDWNTVKTLDDALKQPWFNKMINAEGPPLTFDELTSKPIDFSAYAMNRLKLTKLTREVPILIDYDKDAALGIKHWRPQRQQFYRAMINKTSTHNVLSKMRILSVVSVEVEKKFGYGYLIEIVVKRADHQLYKFKEGDFPDLHLNEIDGMLLLLTQNRLFNLNGDVIVHLGVDLRMFTRGIVIQSRVEDVQLDVESYQRKLNLTRPLRSCPGMSAKELYTLNYDPQDLYMKTRKSGKD